MSLSAHTPYGHLVWILKTIPVEHSGTFHTCAQCGSPIYTGEPYVYQVYVIVDTRDFVAAHFCAFCH